MSCQDDSKDNLLPSPKDADNPEIKAEDEQQTGTIKQKTTVVKSSGKVIILIGLDFGMTRSGKEPSRSSVCCRANHSVGIFWCIMRSGHIKSCQPFDGWPGTEQNATKIPTAITYSQNSLGLKQLRVGNEIDVDSDVSAWFKELLNSDQPHDEELDDPLICSAIGEGLSRLPLGVTREEAVMDFLKYMNEQFLSMLKGNYGQKFLDQSEFRYMLTHPAKWSESAKNRLRTAARAAGLHNQSQSDVSFMTEPEAAMMAVLTEHQAEYGKGSIPFEVDVLFVAASRSY